jgi:hypothetical protein
MKVNRSLTLHLAELLGAAALFYVGLYPPKATADAGCKNGTTCNLTTSAGTTQTGTCTGSANSDGCTCYMQHTGSTGGTETSYSSDCNPLLG